MPLASRLSRLTMLSAQMNGMVNEVSRNPKFVFTGEAFIFIKSSPTEAATKDKTATPQSLKVL